MDHPVRLIVNDDLQRTRLTVFFRLLLAIPHLIVCMLFAIVAYLLAIVNWFATLFAGRSPQGLHDFQARFLRYSTHVYAYMFLLADPFPPFGGSEAYAVDLEVAPPQDQGRLGVFFRIILAIPALILRGVLDYLLQILAFLGWFACLFTGRMPEGMRNLGAYCLRYQAQTFAYVLLLTDRYPSLSTGETQEASAATTT
jgi:uncharacterized protein DUF4389